MKWPLFISARVVNNIVSRNITRVIASFFWPLSKRCFVTFFASFLLQSPFSIVYAIQLGAMRMSDFPSARGYLLLCHTTPYKLDESFPNIAVTQMFTIHNRPFPKEIVWIPAGIGHVNSVRRRQ